MFLSLFLILFFGVLGGLLFNYLKVPKIIWYLVLGILLGPSILNLIDSSILNISSYLRQIALVIILTRSGLSLDIKKLKEIGRPAILMCFLPALFEILGVLLLGPVFLGISYLEALLVGSILAAVSPAVVVPRMIKLKEEGYGKERMVPDLVMAGASCDDIFVIILFYSFKSLVASNSFDYVSLLNIPVSILLGIIVGVFVGIVLVNMFKYIKLDTISKSFIVLGVSLLLLYFETYIKTYFSFSALLSIIVLNLVLFKYKNEDAIEIKKVYNGLWSFFEILLFVLVGAITDINYAFSINGLKILGLISLSLLFRSLGTYLCLVMTKFNKKEKIYIILSYLPKATVQASIGGICLAEGMPIGTICLTAAVVSILFTAPLGAILMDNTYKTLLEV